MNGPILSIALSSDALATPDAALGARLYPLLWWTAQNLAVAAILAGGVWLACRWRRIGPVGRHALWLVVLIKLLTPPLVAWPWAVGEPLQVASSARLAEPVAAPAPARVPPAIPPLLPDADMPGPLIVLEPDEGVLMDVVPTPGGAAGAVRGRGSEHAPMASSSGSGRMESEARLRWVAWALPALAAIWLAGAIAFAIVEGVRIVRMLQRLRRSAPASDALQRQIRDLARRMKVPPVRARLVAGIGSPAIWALTRPVLLWPAELSADVNADSVRGLIVHELAHVRRRDHWLGWLELLGGFVWWWNPLFWYVRHQMRENAELACDGWVVDTLPGGRRAYAEGLLNVCESLARGGAPMPAVGVNTGSRRFLERRLAMIMRERVPLRLPRIGLLTIALLALTALPAWSQRVKEPAADRNNEAAAARAEREVAEAKVRSAQAALAERSARDEEDAAAAARDDAARYRDAINNYHMTVTRRIADRLPADAQKVLEDYRLQQAKATEEAIVQLTRIQQRYAEAGKTTEAAAIAARIQQLQQPAPTGVGGIGGPRRAGGEIFLAPTRGIERVLADPGNLMQFRDRVGQTFYFVVIGQTEGDPVWGSDIYTDDSALAVAAVHAGVLRPTERGIVRVDVLPGRDSYEGTTQHGVTTSPYGAWQGSYRVSRAPFAGNAGGEPIGIAGGTGPRGGGYHVRTAHADPGTLTDYRGLTDKVFYFDVTGSTDRTIWGDGVYTDDSALATAAVHAGLLKNGERGVVKVTILEGRQSYEGTTQNGVTSRPYGPWEGSYRVESAGLVANGATLTLPPDTKWSVAQRAFDLYSGLPADDGRPHARFLSGGPPDLRQFREMQAGILLIEVTGSTDGMVWGDGVYTDDSTLAAAAVHAGVLRDGQKGIVAVTLLPGRDEYAGSTHNGVTTQSYGAWGGSFRIDKAALGDPVPLPSTGKGAEPDRLRMAPQSAPPIGR